MEGLSQTPERGTIRSEAEANAVINTAIQEAIDTFGESMGARDRQMLAAVIAEEGTDPMGRVAYLVRTKDALNVSSEMKGYINVVLQTLRQRFTAAEQARFSGFGRSMLDDIA